jgi:hypothetical protein
MFDDANSTESGNICRTETYLKNEKLKSELIL